MAVNTASSPAASAAAQGPVQQAERLLVDITQWRRDKPARPDALSLVRQREPQAARETVLPPSRGVVTEMKAIGMELDNGGKILLRGRKLTYRSQF
ncbi:hypothetical protein [Ramlibacter humi]|uniref:Uncharacterized protein n=1 Tax=Ramlibacter humi TaxID=2530451 RepID=A0A4Z0CAX7_9BURK|nr:hypothetical protein [Ramlibacter humi]TFZ08062.1 hypothetical protein EZ216_02525 [Ramlibacter humi]